MIEIYGLGLQAKLGTKSQQQIPLRNMLIYLILSTFLNSPNQKLSMDKMQSSGPKKDEDFMLMTGVTYHVLCKRAYLLDEINIRPWENKKQLKQSHHLIY